MAKLTSEMKIGITIDPIVKVQCYNTGCMHNLSIYTNEFCCNLKHITLSPEGECAQFRKSEK